MVVQCEHCQTKYRIADEKVKGKGVKVRCAKCENVFTVTPPESDIQAPAAPPPELPTPEPPASEPTASEFDVETGPAGVNERVPDSSGEAAPEAPASDPFEAPASLPPLSPQDSLLGRAAPEEVPFPPTPGPEDQPPGGHVPSAPIDGSLDLGSQRPAHELDQSILVSHPPEPTGLADDSDPEDDGFEIEQTLREDTAPGFTDPDAEAGGLPPLTQETPPDGEWGNIPVDGQSTSDEDNSTFGLAGESGYVPPPPMPMEEPPDLPAEDWDDSAHESTSVPAYQPETPTSGGGKKAIIFLLLLAALGGGGYFAYPTVMDMIQSKTQQVEGTLTPTNIQVKSLTRNDGKIIYSVRGEVRNESEGNVGMIQVEAQFRNASGDVLGKATSFCGNLMPDSDLVRLEMEKVRSDLQNELGQSLSNASITPGQAVPFLVVLDNPPSGINKVTVTISSFKETT